MGRVRTTVVGIVLLVALGATAAWVRSGRAPRATAGSTDLSAADGVVKLGEGAARVSLSPRPLLPFAPFSVRVELEPGAAPLVAPTLSFRMAMEMGPHDYTLLRGPSGVYEATGVVLPACASGGREWLAELASGEATRRVRGSFRLLLAERPR